MQQMEQTAEWGGAERKRVEAVVETLANLRGKGESLAEVAHDARNMVTALGLYCDLLEEPGVLATPYLHYGSELRLVATASRRLVEKLVALDTSLGTSLGTSLDTHQDTRQATSQAPPRAAGHTAEFTSGCTPGDAVTGAAATDIGVAREAGRFPVQRWTGDRAERWDLLPAEPIHNLAGELLANRNLLAALAGPSIALTVDAAGGSKPVRLTGEDLTRVLVNLVKNAAEAMPAGGRIQLGLREHPASSGAAAWLSLTVEDNGPGLPEEVLDRIFESGYSTKSSRTRGNGGWPATHRGLGLAITRSIVEEAGGRIHASNRSPSGARFEIELPVRER
jgi:signal transduction histidine kinase